MAIHFIRHRAPFSAGLPFMYAAPSDALWDTMGTNLHASGPYTAATVDTAMTYTKLRHGRFGRVNPGDVLQRAIAVKCAQLGVDGIFIVDDAGAQTPLTRKGEALSPNYGGIQVAAWEPPNEPQRRYATLAAWLNSVPTNGPDSTDTTLGKEETVRQHKLVWDTIMADAIASQSPILACSMSTKDNPGWYQAYADAMVAGGVTVASRSHIGNVHEYPGAQTPDGSLQLTNQLEAARLAYGMTRMWLTETGYHNALVTMAPIAISSVAGAVITVPSQSWGADDLVPMVMRITSGPGAGQVRSVTANTATTITLASAFTTAPTSASSFVLDFSHRGAPEGVVASYMARLPFENPGFERIYTYELLDEPGAGDPHNERNEKEFGLCLPDGSPKLAGTALRNLALLYEAGGSTISGGIDGTLTAGGGTLAAAGIKSDLRYNSVRNTYQLALWRPDVSLWTPNAQTPIAPPSDITVTLALESARPGTVQVPATSASSSRPSATTHDIAVGADLVVLDLAA